MKMETLSLDYDTETAFASLFSALASVKTSADATATAESSRKLIESKLGGPAGVVGALIPLVWLETKSPHEEINSETSPSSAVQGDDALAILTYLVETHPSFYVSATAQAVRHDAEAHLNEQSSKNRNITDALLTSMAKLIIAPNSESEVGISTDAHAALLSLCKYNSHEKDLAKRLFDILICLWDYLQRQQQRESSTAQMRIADLMIDVCLLGDNEIEAALHGPQCIMVKLLQLALDYPNNDPLLQMSALDQIERLAVNDSKYPMSTKRAEFLLSSDVLRKGLFVLVGVGDEEFKVEEENQEMDPINGGAALRLLTAICRVGVLSMISQSSQISEETWKKFETLLQMFQRAIRNFHPKGELERLSYIHAASSLVASCSIVASSTESSTLAKDILNSMWEDTTVLHEWLSLHSRVSQPKLKSAFLSSLSQVMEPIMWSDDVSIPGPANSTSVSNINPCTRPNDAIVMQLYQALSDANNGRDSTELILVSAKSPFVEERLGAYSLLQAFAMRGLGLRLLLLHEGGGASGGFLEWLLMHELETTIEGKQAKYKIVESMLLCNKEFIRGIVSDKVYNELELWLRRGPTYVRSVPWEMATE
mmetsp:Transcript_22003/g.43631  ORF Transcript_22003/g.43631 Transcript_22003/m.43631 type:complete len:597 (-) Transcript_22003:131-1921(-)